MKKIVILRFVKIILLVLMCTISWYGGMKFSLNAGDRRHTIVEFKTNEFNTSVPAAPSKEDDSIVYVTRDGDKYHEYDCTYLKKVIITTPKGAEDANYKYCTYCTPPME